MSLGYRFFTITIRDTESCEEQLNSFLRSVSVVVVRKEFVADGRDSFWSVCVEYMDSLKTGRKTVSSAKSRVDYKEVLPPEDFTLYAKLRDWRRDIANEAAVPVYNVFTNEQLAKLAGMRPSTVAAMMSIEGIGEARTKKYGEAILQNVAEFSLKQKDQQDEEGR